MDREKLDQWCEWCIFGLVMAMLAWAPLAMGAVLPFGFLVLQGLACLVIIAWMARICVNPKHRILWPPISWAVLAFVGYTIVRYQYSDIEFAARQELVRVLVYAVVFFAIVTNINRQGLVMALCVGLIVVASLESAYAAYQFGTHSRTVWHVIRPASYGDRVGGTFINPNHLAGFLEMILPLSVSLAIASRLGHAYRIFIGYLGAVMLAGVALTVSRGGYGAVGASLAALLLILLRRREYRIPAAILLALAALGIWYFMNHSSLLQDRYRGIAISSGWDVRPMIWQAAISMWQDHPWFGVGPGHFDWRFNQYRPSIMQIQPDYAHNDYLNTLSEWGIVGAALIILALVLAAIGLAKTWSRVQRAGNDLHTKKGNKPAIVLGVAMGLLAMLAHAVTEFNMQIPSNALVAVALLGILSAYLRFATESYWITLRLLGKFIATASLAGLLFYLASEELKRASVYRLTEQAGREKDLSRRSTLLEAALEIDPNDESVCFQIANGWRMQALGGTDGWEQAARFGLRYLDRGIDINPLNPYNYTGYGQCLDWLGQTRRATSFYDHALILDPNNADIFNLRAWHAIELRDFAQARRWFGRSLVIKRWYNPFAEQYYSLMTRRLAEDEADAKSPIRRALNQP